MYYLLNLFSNQLLKTLVTGPILVGGKSKDAFYRDRVVVLHNYVRGETFTLASTFPGSVEKIVFSGNSVLVWSEPAHSKAFIYSWQSKSSVTAWSRKTGAFLRALEYDQIAIFAQLEQEDISFDINRGSKKINMSTSLMNVVPTKGGKNIWMTLSVLPDLCNCAEYYLNCYKSSCPYKMHEKTGKMAIRTR